LETAALRHTVIKVKHEILVKKGSYNNEIESWISVKLGYLLARCVTGSPEGLLSNASQLLYALRVVRIA
jgi:hypothetical protein